MNKEEASFLFEYNIWANTLIFDAAAGLKEGQFTAPYKISFGSLRGTLVHLVGVEEVWRLRCQEGLYPTALPADDKFPTLASLRAFWQTEEQKWQSYLASLPEGALDRVVQYKTTQGVRRENILGQLLSHVVNHGTQFRAEAAVALSAYGCSPGDLDLLRYLREH
jgi:uncharacterized damage-inducible protein DinB